MLLQAQHVDVEFLCPFCNGLPKKAPLHLLPTLLTHPALVSCLLDDSLDATPQCCLATRMFPILADFAQAPSQTSWLLRMSRGNAKSKFLFNSNSPQLQVPDLQCSQSYQVQSNAVAPQRQCQRLASIGTSPSGFSNVSNPNTCPFRPRCCPAFNDIHTIEILSGWHCDLGFSSVWCCVLNFVKTTASSDVEASKRQHHRLLGTFASLLLHTWRPGRFMQIQYSPKQVVKSWHHSPSDPGLEGYGLPNTHFFNTAFQASTKVSSASCYCFNLFDLQAMYLCCSTACWTRKQG